MKKQVSSLIHATLVEKNETPGHDNPKPFTFRAYRREEEPGVISILRGYSRDHRPDLKQVVVGLLTTYHSALPTWIQAASGNADDAKTVPELIKAYVEQLGEGEEPLFVAESSLYSEENLAALSEVKFSTKATWLNADTSVRTFVK
jgi:transposase